jgi:hypothetical protein
VPFPRSAAPPEFAVNQVPPEQVDLVWTRVEPVLSRAVRRGRGHFTTRDLRRAVVRGEQQLWMVTEEGRLIAALVSEVNLSPAKRGTLTVYCGAGRNARGWVGDAVATIGAYARGRGCAELRVVGRRGWERHLAPYGFSPEAIVFVRDEVFA